MKKIDELNAVNLGIQGENADRFLEVDCSEWLSKYPDGNIAVKVLRPGETTPYIAATTLDGNILKWVFSAGDTAYAGTGTAEIQLTDGDVIRKSRVMPTVIAHCLEGVAQPEPPAAEQSWIDQVISYKDDTLAAKEAVENLEVSAVGGDDAGVEKTVSEGVVHLEFTLPRGEKGADGQQGIQGVPGQNGADGNGIASVSASHDGVNRRTAVTVSYTDHSKPSATFYIPDGYGVTDAEKAVWNGKQDAVTATGILKRNSNGNIVAADMPLDYINTTFADARYMAKKSLYMGLGVSDYGYYSKTDISGNWELLYNKTETESLGQKTFYEATDPKDYLTAFYVQVIVPRGEAINSYAAFRVYNSANQYFGLTYSKMSSSAAEDSYTEALGYMVNGMLLGYGNGVAKSSDEAYSTCAYKKMCLMCDGIKKLVFLPMVFLPIGTEVKVYGIKRGDRNA